MEKLNMWQYLPEHVNSAVVWKCVGTAWGQQSYDDVVELHRKSSTFGYILNDQFAALACITPVHATTSGWLMVWLQPELRRNRKGFVAQTMIWQELHKLIFEQLKLLALVVVSDRRAVIRLAERFGGRERERIKHLYGRDKHGYIAVWEQE